MYLTNVVGDLDDVQDRAPLWSEAARLRVAEMRGLLVESGLFDKVYMVSQGRGQERKRYPARTMDKGHYTVVYLPILSYGMFLCNLSAVFSATLWLMRHVRKGDVVCVYNGEPANAIPALLVWLLRRTRLVAQFEELYRGLGRKYVLHRVFEKAIARVADGFVVSNVGILDCLGLNMDTHRVAIASGYASDCHGVSSDESSFPEDGPLVLLYAGTLDEIRGVKKFIETFVTIKSDAKLRITGSGPLEFYVRGIAARHHNIEYLGVLSEQDLADVIRGADLCVNPQRTRCQFSDSSFPSKVVNYLAHGKTVIATETVSLVNSRYGDMVVFYDDQTKNGLQVALDTFKQERRSMRRRAQAYPSRVKEIKRQEKSDVLRVLRVVSTQGV